MLTLAYQHEVQLRQMRVTTANHVRRALRDPWWTLSLITQAVTFVLVNASLQNTKVSVSCHTCCDGCRFALEFGKHASSFCQRIAGWKIALEGKKKRHINQRKGAAWMYFMVSTMRLQMPSVQFLQQERVWRYSLCLITLYIWHLAQVPSEADRNQLTPGEQRSAGKPLNTNVMVMLSNTSGVLWHNMGW